METLKIPILFSLISTTFLNNIIMTNYTKLPAILLLADGTVYYGKAAGKIGTTTGEICFNTGMTGYQEIFTDPSYFGQIMVTTNAHIGNYGIHKGETESNSIKIAGLVCKNYNIGYSRKQADESLQDYFQDENIVGISDIDTRALVRHIRDRGAMNAIISSEITDLEALKAKLAEVPEMDGLELSSQVSTKEPYFYGDENATFKVAAIDFGIKQNTLRNFDERDLYIQVYPAKTSFEEMDKWGAPVILRQCLMR
jgi:carbamoyl-phosphate synthase small subunit